MSLSKRTRSRSSQWYVICVFHNCVVFFWCFWKYTCLLRVKWKFRGTKYLCSMYLNTRCDLTNYFLNPCPCLSTNFKYVCVASAKENSSKRRIALNESSKKLVLNREFRQRKIQRFFKQWRSLSKWKSSSELSWKLHQLA